MAERVRIKAAYFWENTVEVGSNFENVLFILLLKLRNGRCTVRTLLTTLRRGIKT